MCTCGLPNMSTLSPQVDISGRPLMPMLQLLNIIMGAQFAHGFDAQSG